MNIAFFVMNIVEIQWKIITHSLIQLFIMCLFDLNAKMKAFSNRAISEIFKIAEYKWMKHFYDHHGKTSRLFRL